MFGNSGQVMTMARSAKRMKAAACCLGVTAAMIAVEGLSADDADGTQIQSCLICAHLRIGFSVLRPAPRAIREPRSGVDCRAAVAAGGRARTVCRARVLAYLRTGAGVGVRALWAGGGWARRSP